MKTQPTKYRGVKRLPDGRFQTIARYKDPRDGASKRIVRVVSVATTAEAERLRQESREEVLAGLSPQRMRLAEYALSWLQRKAGELAPSTVDRYGSTLEHKIIPALGELYIDAVQSADLVRWRDNLAKTHAGASTNGHLRILKGLFADAANELRIHNPAERIKQVAEVRGETRKGLAAAELRELLTSMRTLDLPVYTVLVTMALTGMRWGEVSALHWSDITQHEIHVRRSRWHKTTRQTTKTGSSRRVPVVPELWATLEQLRAFELRRRSEACPLAFPTDEGGMRSRTWAAKALDRCFVASGVRRVTPHGLRHTWSDLLRRVTTADVQKALTGHTTDAMREHYSHVDAGEKMGAAKAALVLVKAK